MPYTVGAMLLGAACLAGLPPSAGFTGEWLLFQSVLGAMRLGGLGVQIAICALAAGMALATALAATAAVRLVGVALLGRPRTPRAAAAIESGPPTRWALILLGGLSLGMGLAPSSVMALVEPALQRLSSGSMAQRAGALVLAPQLDGPGYAPLGLALLLGLVGAVIAAVLRARTVAGHRMSASWDCGFGAPPAWLPNGDPASEYAGGSFAQPLRRALGATLLDARETVVMPLPDDIAPARYAERSADPADRLLFGPTGRFRAVISNLADRLMFLTVRQSLSVLFAALVLFLALVAALEQT
jgi:NADH:ubiquinone oxidoreductase subunit 5 (subunit L)/multisubunit Na+/H+ antiporter MnhA subunit